MANHKSGNLVYIDTVDLSISEPNIRLMGVILNATSGSVNPVITLAEDNSSRSYPALLTLSCQWEEKCKYYDFSRNPLVFPSGIRVSTLTSATATLIVDKNRDKNNGG